VTVRLAPILLVLALGGLLTGCGASDNSGASDGSVADAAPVERAAAGAGSPGKAASSSRSVKAAGSAQSFSASQSATQAAVTRRVRTGDLTVEVPSLPPALARVRAVALSLGGVVSGESSRFPTARSSAAQSVLTLRVPEPRMDDALDRVAAVGRPLKRSTTSEDVTATLADLDSRVASAQRSVTRVRDLMDRATSLKDVVLLESELSQRQSDLESEQARQRVLNDQATLSTITVELRTPAAAPKPAKNHHGFTAGLHSGWHAMERSTTGLLTVLGALLPLAVLVAVFGVPGYLIYRRRHPRNQPTTP
jgi:hypothetical protein